MSIRDAADALRTQYDQAGILGEGMILSVGTGVTPPPAGPKLQVIDVIVADGYTPPAESATGYDSGGSHFRVRTYKQPDGAARVFLSLSA